MSLPSMRLPSMAIVLLLGLALPASAQWMWRDKSGQLHASDLPPPREVPDKDVLRRPPLQQRQHAELAEAAASTPSATPAAASAPAASASRVDPELEARRKRAEQEQAAQRKQASRQEEERVALAKAENCRRAQDQLRMLDSGMRMAHVNERGEREIIDDSTRAREARRARDAIAANCR